MGRVELKKKACVYPRVFRQWRTAEIAYTPDTEMCPALFMPCEVHRV